MQGNLLLLLLVMLPIAASPIAYALGRKRPAAAIWTMAAASAACLVMSVMVLLDSLQGQITSFSWEGFCGLGLMLGAEGFQALYAVICSLMWLGTSLFSKQYFAAHGHNIGRYAFFTLFTLGASLGVLLSDSLYSTFLFFEMMSLASYPWVAHEETPDAMRAAQTYLYIAIIGGLVMLMGLFLLPQGLVVTPYAMLGTACAEVGAAKLWLPAALMLVGFGAKAGSVPLHIWLPKAHPVAPAPASALLSGMLTKTGVFGMLVLTAKIMRHNADWGMLIFWLGIATMFLGAVLALFSVNLKRTLACSSLSQIGFIMVGTGLCALLGEHNSLAAFGTVQHMLNHSLLKLVLFICAGVVYMNTHKLNLNDVRGFGRNKPVLHLAFLLGLLGIGGVPLFNGYISKSLLHEGLLEYIAALSLNGQSVWLYSAAEWLFLLSGGLTLAYMLKLYICLFWQKHPTQQAEFDGMRRKYLSPLSAITIVCCALLLPLLGMLPGVLMTGVGNLSLGFLDAHAPAHAIHYFSVENLTGAAKSLVIGALVYLLVVRPLLTRPNKDGLRTYADRWPTWLDLEDLVYRPALAFLCKVGHAIADIPDRSIDAAALWIKDGACASGRVLEMPMDGLTIAARRSVFKHRRENKRPHPVGTRLTYAVGSALDAVVRMLNKTIRRKNPIQIHFVSALAAGQEEISSQAKRLTKSISYGLLLFCLGLFITLFYLVLF